MKWIQFYHLSTGYIAGTIPPQFGEPKPIEACGDRSVIIIDARRRVDEHHRIATVEGKKRGYIGYTLNSGERFEPKTSTKYQEIK